MSTAAVQADPSRNKFFAIYLSSIGVLGIGLIVAAVLAGWGAWAYMLGGILALSGIGGGISMLVTGGAGTVACPKCGHGNEVLHISQGRILECAGCGEWLEGSREMAPVAADHVHSFPVFTCPMPEHGLQWVQQSGVLICPCCGQSSSGMKTIEGTSAVGSAAAMVSPISVQRVVKLQVPVCPEHDDGVAVYIDDGKKLGFRSIYYMRLFRQANGV